MRLLSRLFLKYIPGAVAFSRILGYLIDDSGNYIVDDSGNRIKGDL
jgi:hypothetical protein